MPNEINKKMVAELSKKVADAKSIVFAEYHGLDANQISDLRKQLRESGGDMTVAKNTLVKLALKENGHNGEIEKELEGPVAAFFGNEDAIAPIKILAEFAKNFELPKIKVGLVDGRVATASEIDVLSKLPSREELLARVVGGLKSPLSGIVNVLGGSQRKIVTVLSAIADKKSEE